MTRRHTPLDAGDFRRIALGMQDAIEGSHMGHPDYRVNGRIFATLHHDQEWGMVKLTPAQQERLAGAYPDVFVPENGAWGRAGCTAVRLASVPEDVLGEAITLAWQNTAAGKATPGAAGRRRKAARSAGGAKRDR